MPTKTFTFILYWPNSASVAFTVDSMIEIRAFREFDLDYARIWLREQFAIDKAECEVYRFRKPLEAHVLMNGLPLDKASLDDQVDMQSFMNGLKS